MYIIYIPKGGISMNLNVRIIRDELPEFTFTTHFVRDRSNLDCSYPLIFAPGMTLRPGRLYLARAEELPYRARHIKSELSIVVLGDLPDCYDNEYVDAISFQCETCSLEVLLEKVSEVFRRYNAWEAELGRALVERRPLPAIAAASRDVARNPLLLSFSNYRVAFHDAEYLRSESEESYRAYCRSYGEEDRLLEEDAFPSMDMLNMLTTEKSYAESDNQRTPTVIKDNDVSYESLFVNLVAGGRYYARLLMDAAHHPICDKDFVVVEILADALDRAIKIGVESHLTGVKEVDLVLGKLLAHKLVEEASIEHAISKLGWGVHDAYVVLMILPHAQVLHKDVLEAYGGRLEQQIEHSYSYVADDALALVLNRTQAGGAQADINTQVLPLLRDNMLVAGVSMPFYDFKQLYYSCQQASRAAVLGARKNPEQWIHHYTNLLLDDVADRLLERRTPQSFELPGFTTLELYDRAHEDNLVDLLEVYLACNCNIAETARQLFIHRNTCLYRLGRIGDISGLNLEDADTRLELEILFLLRRRAR